MPFRFLKHYSDQNSDQVLGKFINWKPPKLYKGKRWWVEYQFRIPEELRPRYNGARWKGFPVFEDINRYKSDEYAELLLKAVRFALEQGFNPFEYELNHSVANNLFKPGISLLQRPQFRILLVILRL
jgi:hypothetical protein